MTDTLQGRAIEAIDGDAAIRFWEKTIPEPNTGCTIWLGASGSGGYGTFWTHGRSKKAHRVSYAIHNGGIPEGLDVMHTCDNTYCVNPAHLRAVPTSMNIRDAFNKGRLHRRGDKNSRTKIPDREIELITRLAEAGSRHRKSPTLLTSIFQLCAAASQAKGREHDRDPSCKTERPVFARLGVMARRLDHEG